MSNQPEPNLGLACNDADSYGKGPRGAFFMTTAKDDMLLKTLEELLRAWLAIMSPIEIGSDPAKIRLLREISVETDGEPSPFVKQVYEEVFLRDVWTRRRHPGA